MRQPGLPSDHPLPSSIAPWDPVVLLGLTLLTHRQPRATTKLPSAPLSVSFSLHTSFLGTQGTHSLQDTTALLSRTWSIPPFRFGFLVVVGRHEVGGGRFAPRILQASQPADGKDMNGDVLTSRKPRPAISRKATLSITYILPETSPFVIRGLVDLSLHRMKLPSGSRSQHLWVSLTMNVVGELMMAEGQLLREFQGRKRAC
jgi:hypothetical protein